MLGIEVSESTATMRIPEHRCNCGRQSCDAVSLCLEPQSALKLFLPAGGGLPHEKSEATNNNSNKGRVFADLAPAEPVRERRLSASGAGGAGEGTQT